MIKNLLQIQIMKVTEEIIEEEEIIEAWDEVTMVILKIYLGEEEVRYKKKLFNMKIREVMLEVDLEGLEVEEEWAEDIPHMINKVLKKKRKIKAMTIKVIIILIIIMKIMFVLKLFVKTEIVENFIK